MELAQLVTSTKRFLAVLAPLLSEWGQQFQQFQQGLVRCQPGVIEQSLNSLKDNQQRLNNLLKIREQILRHASHSGLSVKTLKELAKHFSAEVAVELYEAIEESEVHLRRLHQQLWSMWVISNRSQHSLSQMLLMFTQDSRQQEIYSPQLVHQHQGGLLLDAAI